MLLSNRTRIIYSFERTVSSRHNRGLAVCLYYGLFELLNSNDLFEFRTLFTFYCFIFRYIATYKPDVYEAQTFNFPWVLLAGTVGVR